MVVMRRPFLQHRFCFDIDADGPGNPLLRQNDGRNVLDMIGARAIAADSALQAAVDAAILRLDTRAGGADATDAAAAASASHSHMKRQWSFLFLMPASVQPSSPALRLPCRHNQFRAMFQDKRRTAAMQQSLTSKRLGPADATQPKPPPSPEPEATAVRSCFHAHSPAVINCDIVIRCPLWSPWRVSFSSSTTQFPATRPS
jgi:hypothetical protein